jgi:hypothetical protein
MKMMKPAKMGKAMMPKATATKPAKVVPPKSPKTTMKPTKKGY